MDGIGHRAQQSTLDGKQGKGAFAAGFLYDALLAMSGLAHPFSDTPDRIVDPLVLYFNADRPTIAGHRT